MPPDSPSVCVLSVTPHSQVPSTTSGPVCQLHRFSQISISHIGFILHVRLYMYYILGCATIVHSIVDCNNTSCSLESILSWLFANRLQIVVKLFFLMKEICCVKVAAVEF